MLVEVRFRVSEDVVRLLKVEDVSSAVRLMFALELYREGLVSLGKAAEIAGLSIREFMYELSKRKIPINYTVENLREDLKVLEEL